MMKRTRRVTTATKSGDIQAETEFSTGITEPITKVEKQSDKHKHTRGCLELISATDPPPVKKLELVR
jgi:hypothetical protein